MWTVDAPVFYRDTSPLGQAFNHWTRHWNTCTTCRRQHWYEPDDKRRLCKLGRVLFAQWYRFAFQRGVWVRVDDDNRAA
ncbi:MAG: hypothetical protein KatS3mg081_0594 [Gemmatimonadales bacterium]|nr:MAG: hypothetical protein KatS3mg081_0594 [Gemmatimonadales bacterium]